LVIDFLSITSLSVATVMPIESAQQKFLLGAGIGGYALGGPMVHAGHGHVGKAVGSFVLRALPPLVMLDGAQTEVCNAEGDSCTNDRSVLFLGVAFVPVVMLIDALVIAREEVPARPNSGVQIMPWLEPTTRRFGAGIRGAF